MRKFVGFIKGFPNRLKTQWKNLFNSKHKAMSEGAAEEYKSHPSKARGDNWRRPDAHDHRSSKHRK